MKRKIFILILLICCIRSYAQIPYFAKPVGHAGVYGYTSLQIRPGIDTLGTYSTILAGIGKNFALGADLMTGFSGINLGFAANACFEISQWFNIGAQVTPSFDLNDKFNFAYNTTLLMMNGGITKDGNLFWCTNTYWIIDREAYNSIFNYEYLGYSINFGKGGSLTPMLGMIHSWKFDQDPDLAVGLYYSIDKFNIYIWGNEFFQPNPCISIAFDFAI